MKECVKCGTCYGDEILLCPADQSKTRLTLPGDQLLANRYWLESRLGRGAMGQVYLAQDRNLGTRKVAVKTVRQDVLNSEDLQEGEALARFEREAMSAASIRHPHIVDVTDFGESEDGVFFLVMEYVEGESLHKILRREGTLPIRRGVKILRQIADGVDAAHKEGILHRDLKPANIFIMQNNNQDGFIKVGDFGLAKIVNQTVTDTNSDITPSSRGIVGTPEFMSPEQMQPELGVDVRTDIYALGTIAYLMFAGRTPFTGDLMELIMQKVIQETPPLSQFRTDIPAEVEKVIMSALQREPDKRVGTVAEWITELEKAAEDVGEDNADGHAKVIILAPIGAEVYVDDERRGSVGSSGRLILTTVPAGQHILRVSKKGEKDDERVIEIREGGEKQVIQAQLRAIKEITASQPSNSQANSSISGAASSLMPGLVMCNKCNSRFAEGIQFCGRCGNNSFSIVSLGQAANENICPRCSAQLPFNSKFCGRCGFNIIEKNNSNIVKKSVDFINQNNESQISSVQKRCPQCNSIYLANVKFCGRCGINLS